MAIKIQAAPLPSNFVGTPQELIEAFLDRVEIISDETSFVISDVEPDGNEGPWLKNGKQWWVWDEDTSAYVPLDISESFDEQIFIGTDEPPLKDDDVTPQQLVWLKISDTNTVLGLYYWFGTVVGWVTQEVGVQPDSVGENELKTDAVTRTKIKNGEVIASKIQNDLPLSKLARGTARQFLQMKSDASVADWQTFIQESTELAITLETVIDITHEMDVVPNYREAFMICKEADKGWEVGDELKLESNDTNIVNVFANATKVGVIFRGTPVVRRKDSPGSASVTIDLSKWKFKFYFARG